MDAEAEVEKWRSGEEKQNEKVIGRLAAKGANENAVKAEIQYKANDSGGN